MIAVINSFVVINILLIFISESTSDGVVKVNVRQGEVIGRSEETFWDGQIYYSFKGIPFAEPPIGELKFQPPVEHETWDVPYEAFEEKPTCVQFNGRDRNKQPKGISGSEDCLYISVFSPSLQAKNPVIVFDYNDNFRGGFNGSKTYSPDFFMEEDVVVVYIHHRLGLFGYLTTEDEVIPPNIGLKDFILGLKWVQNNIKNFGGDPERVTIMGSVGGAALAEILLYSDAAKDLFSGIIMQSGTALQSTLFNDQTSLKSFELGDQLEIKTNNSFVLLDHLQKVNSETLLVKEGNLSYTQVMTDYQLSKAPFGPTIERGIVNSVIDDLPENSNIINDVPVLIGINSREGLDLALEYVIEPRLVMGSHDTFWVFPLRTNFRFNTDSSAYVEAINDVLHYYLKLGYFAPQNVYEYSVYVGDILHSYPTDVAAKLLSKKLESNVYYYMFDYLGEFNENIQFITTRARSSSGNWGATLTDELCYLHLCSRIKEKYIAAKKRPSSEPEEIKVTRKMVRMWSNFAKSRNPTPEINDSILKGFVWEPIDKSSDDTQYLHISKRLQMGINPLGDRRRFWDEFLAKYGSMAVDGVVQSIEPSVNEPEEIVQRDEL